MAIRDAVESRLEIIELQNAYGVAIDTLNWIWFRRLFTDDVVADYANSGSPPRMWTDADTFTRDFVEFHEDFRATQHMMVSHLVRIQGDVARALCYGHVRLVRRDDPDRMITLVGYYDDRIVRMDREWRFARRRWRSTIQSTDDAAAPAVSLAAEAAAGSIEFLHDESTEISSQPTPS